METSGEVARVAKNEMVQLRASIQLTVKEIHLMCELLVDAFTQITNSQRRAGW